MFIQQIVRIKHQKGIVILISVILRNAVERKIQRVSFADLLRIVALIDHSAHLPRNLCSCLLYTSLLLACGARPIMASDPQEAAEITAAADALNINIGTLNHLLVPAMLDAGRTANRLGIPVLLDPVGVGASSLRRQTVAQLLKELKLSLIHISPSHCATTALL